MATTGKNTSAGVGAGDGVAVGVTAGVGANVAVGTAVFVGVLVTVATAVGVGVGYVDGKPISHPPISHGIPQPDVVGAAVAAVTTSPALFNLGNFPLPKAMTVAAVAVPPNPMNIRRVIFTYDLFPNAYAVISVTRSIVLPSAYTLTVRLYKTRGMQLAVGIIIDTRSNNVI